MTTGKELVEMMQRETIKPSSPTPPHLRSLKLSLLDQFTPISYTSLILFYPMNIINADDPSPTAAVRSQMLKTSLSETLTLFYPLAGRLQDNSSIECRDDGAEFIEARFNCLLSDVLKAPDAKILKQLLPAAIESKEAATGYQLLVQATFFDCGGMAVGMTLSHKIADAATLNSFVKCWSAAALNRSIEAVSPVFMGASIFPPIDLSIPVSSVEMMMQQKCVTKRFVFDGSKIAELKAKLSSPDITEPTRVESVSALIWKCAVAASRSNSAVARPSAWSVSVNLRKRLEPHLPENYAGNCVGNICAKIKGSDELGVRELLSLIRKEMEEFGEKYAKKLKGEGALEAICGFAKEFGELAMGTETDFYNCTSWCRYQLYDADFGWGKPAWLSSASTTFKNVVVLMDTKDGEGIEAWLTLTERDMDLFQSNQELLQFAAVNPAVL